MVKRKEGSYGCLTAMSKERFSQHIVRRKAFEIYRLSCFCLYTGSISGSMKAGHVGI